MILKSFIYNKKILLKFKKQFNYCRILLKWYIVLKYVKSWNIYFEFKLKKIEIYKKKIIKNT